MGLLELNCNKIPINTLLDFIGNNRSKEKHNSENQLFRRRAAVTIFEILTALATHIIYKKVRVVRQAISMQHSASIRLTDHHFFQLYTQHSPYL